MVEKVTRHQRKARRFSDAEIAQRRADIEAAQAMNRLEGAPAMNAAEQALLDQWATGTISTKRYLELCLTAAE